MVADLEARRAQNPEEVSEASIQAVKGSPMGPLAGISDSMFHGTLRPLMSSVSASLTLHGIGIAPILFLVVTNAVHVFVSWFTLHQGFRLGGNLFERVDPAGLKHIMEGAAIAGLMAVGALVANWLSFGLAPWSTRPANIPCPSRACSMVSCLDYFLYSPHSGSITRSARASSIPGSWLHCWRSRSSLGVSSKSSPKPVYGIRKGSGKPEPS